MTHSMLVKLFSVPVLKVALEERSRGHDYEVIIKRFNPLESMNVPRKVHGNLLVDIFYFISCENCRI